ncbi:MAG: OsmC family protein [Acidobacteria bacterium]|jgi:putative redox protein|nr:OsmC family protein [Acidobacteriota bacterium]
MASLSLDWNGHFKFSNSVGAPPISLDSGNPDAMSPMEALAYGAMGCMAMDLVLILQKGRHDLKGLKIAFDGARSEDHPKRYTRLHLIFDITGDVPMEAVERALALSREKYCSVSNSLRSDIDFTTSFTITK